MYFGAALFNPAEKSLASVWARVEKLRRRKTVGIQRFARLKDIRVPVFFNAIRHILARPFV
jgi:hypothetical protein